MGLSVIDDFGSNLLAEEEAASLLAFVLPHLSAIEVSGEGTESLLHFHSNGLRDDSPTGPTAILSSGAASSFLLLSLLAEKILRDDSSMGTADSIYSGGGLGNVDCRGSSHCSSSSM